MKSDGFSLFNIDDEHFLELWLRLRPLTWGVLIIQSLVVCCFYYSCNNTTTHIPVTTHDNSIGHDESAVFTEEEKILGHETSFLLPSSPDMYTRFECRQKCQRLELQHEERAQAWQRERNDLLAQNYAARKRISTLLSSSGLEVKTRADGHFLASLEIVGEQTSVAGLARRQEGSCDREKEVLAEKHAARLQALKESYATQLEVERNLRRHAEAEVTRLRDQLEAFNGMHSLGDESERALQRAVEAVFTRLADKLEALDLSESGSIEAINELKLKTKIDLDGLTSSRKQQKNPQQDASDTSKHNDDSPTHNDGVKQTWKPTRRTPFVWTKPRGRTLAQVAGALQSIKDMAQIPQGRIEDACQPQEASDCATAITEAVVKASRPFDDTIKTIMEEVKNTDEFCNEVLGANNQEGKPVKPGLLASKEACQINEYFEWLEQKNEYLEWLEQKSDLLQRLDAPLSMMWPDLRARYPCLPEDYNMTDNKHVEALRREGGRPDPNHVRLTDDMPNAHANADAQESKAANESRQSKRKPAPEPIKVGGGGKHYCGPTISDYMSPLGRPGWSTADLNNVYSTSPPLKHPERSLSSSLNSDTASRSKPAQVPEPAIPEPAISEPAVSNPAVPEPAAPKPAAPKPADPKPAHDPKAVVPEPAVPEAERPDPLPKPSLPKTPGFIHTPLKDIFDNPPAWHKPNYQGPRKPTDKKSDPIPMAPATPMDTDPPEQPPQPPQPPQAPQFDLEATEAYLIEYKANQDTRQQMQRMIAEHLRTGQLDQNDLDAMPAFEATLGKILENIANLEPTCDAAVRVAGMVQYYGFAAAVNELVADIRRKEEKQREVPQAAREGENVGGTGAEDRGRGARTAEAGQGGNGHGGGGRGGGGHGRGGGYRNNQRNADGNQDKPPADGKGGQHSKGGQQGKWGQQGEGEPKRGGDKDKNDQQRPGRDGGKSGKAPTGGEGKPEGVQGGKNGGQGQHDRQGQQNQQGRQNQQGKPRKGNKKKGKNPTDGKGDQ